MCILALCKCSWRARVALRDRCNDDARKTSFKGHTRRVIRLYVTRSHPTQCYGNAWELSSEGISVCVPYGWKRVAPRGTRVRGVVARIPFLFVFFLFFSFFFIVPWDKACWKGAFNRITRVLSRGETRLYRIGYCREDYIVGVLSLVQYANEIDAAIHNLGFVLWKCIRNVIQVWQLNFMFLLRLNSTRVK